MGRVLGDRRTGMIDVADDDVVAVTHPHQGIEHLRQRDGIDFLEYERLSS